MLCGHPHRLMFVHSWSCSVGARWNRRYLFSWHQCGSHFIIKWGDGVIGGGCLGVALLPHLPVLPPSRDVCCSSLRLCLELQTHTVHSAWCLDLEPVLESGSRNPAGRWLAGNGKEGLLLPLCLLWSWQWLSSWCVVLTCPAPAGNTCSSDVCTQLIQPLLQASRVLPCLS